MRVDRDYDRNAVSEAVRRRDRLALRFRHSICVGRSVFRDGIVLFESQKIDWTIELIAALAWLVLVLSLGAVWLLYFLIRRSAATRVTSLFYLTPAVTALMAWLLFGERLGVLALSAWAFASPASFW